MAEHILYQADGNYQVLKLVASRVFGGVGYL